MEVDRTARVSCEHGSCSERAPGTRGLGWLLRRTGGAFGLAVGVLSWQTMILPTMGVAQGTCVGDCDGSGTVTVNELVEGVSIALGDRPVSDCPSFDPNGDQLVTIDELISGVSSALNGCGGLRMRDAIVMASSDAALMAPATVSQAAKIIDFGSIGGSSLPGALHVARHHSLQAIGEAALASGSTGQQPGTGGAAQQLLFCDSGGTAETSCSSDNAGNFTFDAFYSDCTFTQSGSEIVLNGSVQQTAATDSVCTGSTPVDTNVTFQFTGFDSVQTDPDGTLTFRDASQLTDIFAPSGQGCDGPNNGQAFDGDLSIEIDAPTGEPVYEVGLFATQFILVTASSGSPCQVGVGLDGRLDVTDYLTTQDSTLNFSRFFDLSVFGANGGSDVTLMGGINSACIGTLQIDTAQALHFDTPDALCPSAGALQVTLSDQSVSRIQFSPDGVDFTGDGVPDVSSCVDRSIEQCPGQCMPCQVDEDCPGSQACFTCAPDCTQQPAVDRCAPLDISVQCTDGVF